MNSFDGRIKANAVVVGSGAGGGISFYATDTTDVVVDIDGYFVNPGVASGLVFVPTPPCNMVDTTKPAPSPDNGLNGPSLSAFTARSFDISMSTCAATFSHAQAYSLNITAIPKTTLGYLTMWNSDFPRPKVSTLNAPTGTVTSNALLILTASGSISAYPSDDIDLMIDVNGYFTNPVSAPPGSGFALYTMNPPCRTLDTRKIAPGNPVVGVGTADTDNCLPSPAPAYVTNGTVVPTTSLAFLQLFDPAAGIPSVDTLHALDAQVTSNMAVVADSGLSGLIGYNVASPSAVIIDLTAYFASSALKITTSSLPTGYASLPYTAQLSGQGGVPPYTWMATGLPSTLTLNTTTGVISGSPTTPSFGLVTVTLTDSAGTTAPAAFLPLSINPLLPLSIVTTTLPAGTHGVAYQACVYATGGVTPYNWTVTSGSLPAGLNLSTDTGTGPGTCGDPNGAASISGTPTVAGPFNFVLQVNDARTPPSTATSPFAILVN
jgi:hypothetical protein